MSLRSWLRGLCGAGLSAALALGGAAAAGGEPVRAGGWIAAVNASEGELRLLDGTVLALSRSTEIVDADGRPVPAGELAARTEESPYVRYAGDRRRNEVGLERLVIGLEAAR